MNVLIPGTSFRWNGLPRETKTVGILLRYLGESPATIGAH